MAVFSLGVLTRSLDSYSDDMNELSPELQANPPLPEPLGSSIAELYSAFRNRKLSKGGPDACTYCCASPEAMERIARSDPQHISVDDLSEYHCAAKGESAGEDLTFLLPRTLEVVASGSDLKSAGLFALFARYFPPMWERLDDRERDALRAYSRDLMLWRLTADPSTNWDYGPFDILEMTASGGLDVDAVLDVLSDPPETLSAVDTIIDLVLNHVDLWGDGRGLYEVSEQRAQHVSRRLRDIISSSKTLTLLERIALEDGDVGRAERASLAHQIAENEARKRRSA